MENFDPKAVAMAMELEAAATFGSTEVTEFWLRLCDLYTEDMELFQSPELIGALEEEVKAQHKIFKDEYELQLVPEKVTKATYRLVHKLEE